MAQLKEGTADFYRKRFESSVFGEHAMLPPKNVLENMKSKEEPSAFPSGQDTSFQNLTPMPFRFTEEAPPAVNIRLKAEAKKPPVPPNYMTTSSEIGKIGVEETDLPMRWYGRSGIFTSSWVAPPATRVGTGLGTAMDRSNFHHLCAPCPNPDKHLRAATRAVTNDGTRARSATARPSAAAAP